MQDLSEVFEESEHGFDGSLSGYIVSNKEENYKNWLLSNIRGLKDEDLNKIINVIEKNNKKILIINNLNVDDDFQGNGYGTQVVEDIKSNDFDIAMLIADTTESQRDGFDINKFYKSLGFDNVLNRADFPYMVFPEEKSKEIKNILNIQEKKLKKRKQKTIRP